MSPSLNKTVLLVEDHQPMRELLCEVLRREGYEVIAASNLHAARELIAASAVECSITLLDYFLPDGNGLELQELLPGTKILLMSGVLQTAPISNVDFLAKPFSIKQLASTLKSVLEHTAA